jgi:hypothetical protein
LVEEVGVPGENHRPASEVKVVYTFPVEDTLYYNLLDPEPTVLHSSVCTCVPVLSTPVTTYILED